MRRDAQRSTKTRRRHECRRRLRAAESLRHDASAEWSSAPRLSRLPFTTSPFSMNVICRLGKRCSEEAKVVADWATKRRTAGGPLGVPQPESLLPFQWSRKISVSPAHRSRTLVAAPFPSATGAVPKELERLDRPLSRNEPFPLGLQHPGREPAQNHRARFPRYAAVLLGEAVDHLLRHAIALMSSRVICVCQRLLVPVLAWKSTV